jgi:hypothetical protein
MLWANLILLTIIGLLPTWVALARRHSGTAGIFLINLFLGWTGIGWLVALILALRNPHTRIMKSHVCRNCRTIAIPAVHARQWFFGSDAGNAARLYKALVPAMSCPRCHAPNPIPLNTPAGHKIASGRRWH